MWKAARLRVYASFDFTVLVLTLLRDTGRPGPPRPIVHLQTISQLWVSMYWFYIILEKHS